MTGLAGALPAIDWSVFRLEGLVLGAVLLGIVVRPNGNVSITVKRGSRFGVLDQGAVAALRQATQEVPVPPALRGRESPLKDLLVQYRLTD